MQEISLTTLFIALAVLIVLSGFFSSSETALMRISRFRLKHLAEQGSRSAGFALRLLSKPDRLIGVILLGNNFVNILASAIATVIGLKLAGDAGVAIATVVLTIIILIFAEVGPKTYAAFHPDRIALPAALVLRPLLKVLYPLVWLTNMAANGFLRLIGINVSKLPNDAINREELRAMVATSAGSLSVNDQAMMVNLLDLNAITVEDIMVPRNDIVGIDLEEDWESIQRQLRRSFYTRLPVWHGNVDQIIGVLHVRTIIPHLTSPDFDREALEQRIRKPYFIPEGTRLARQLLEFQRRERRMGFVVDEYGEILGLLTLDDILEEVVGEFTTEPQTRNKVSPGEEADTFLIDGNANLKSLNRRMGWDLPTEDARTINGLILEHLETIPESGTSIKVGDLGITILKTGDNTVQRVRITDCREQST